MFEPTLETDEMGNETVKETQRNVIPNTREPCSSIYINIYEIHFEYFLKKFEI